MSYFCLLQIVDPAVEESENLCPLSFLFLPLCRRWSRIVTRQKWGFSCLSHKSQTWEADAGAKERGFIQLLSQSPSPFSALERHKGPQQDQDKIQGAESLLHVKVQCFGTCRWLLSSPSPHLGSLACSKLLCISGSLLELVYGACMAHGCVLSGERGHERKDQSITRCSRESERLPPGVSGPCGC